MKLLEHITAVPALHRQTQETGSTQGVPGTAFHPGRYALRFFAAMLVLTLAARGVAGASMPRVTVGQAAGGSITRSATAAGTIGARQGAPMTVPEGLLVSGTLAAVGQTLHAGDPVAAFDSAGLAQALAEQQAQVRQLEVACAQQQKGESADGFALQQAQEQLDRAYAEVHETWQEGRASSTAARAFSTSACPSCQVSCTSA